MLAGRGSCIQERASVYKKCQLLMELISEVTHRPPVAGGIVGGATRHITHVLEVFNVFIAAGILQSV
jgi:hypothetical protein